MIISSDTQNGEMSIIQKKDEELKHVPTIKSHVHGLLINLRTCMAAKSHGNGRQSTIWTQVRSFWINRILRSILVSVKGSF